MDFLGKILAADSLPGAFVHSREVLIDPGERRLQEVIFIGHSTPLWGLNDGKRKEARKEICALVISQSRSQMPVAVF